MSAKNTFTIHTELIDGTLSGARNIYMGANSTCHLYVIPRDEINIANNIADIAGRPHNSIIAINSTGVCQDKRARHTWLEGYWAMMDILNPTHILRYGGFIEGENADISTYYVNNNRR